MCVWGCLCHWGSLSGVGGLYLGGRGLCPEDISVQVGLCPEGDPLPVNRMTDRQV